MASGVLRANVFPNSLPTNTTLSVASGARCELYEETLAAITGSGTIELYRDLTLSGGTGTFSGTLESYDLTVTGGADITLSGHATIEQRINLNGATLTMNGTTEAGADLTNNGGILVFNGIANQGITQNSGTLLGTGTINGLLNVIGGTFAPGESIGVFNAAGGLSMAGGTTLDMEISGDAADQVNVTGAVNLGGASLNLTGTPTRGAVFTIIKNDGADAVTNTFGGLAEGATFSGDGHDYEITYQGGTGNDVVLTALTGNDPPSPAPDPAPDPTPDPMPAPTPAPKPRPAPEVSPEDSPSPSGSLNGPVLSWPKVGGTNHYNVYRAACPNCPKTKVGRVAGTSFTDETAQPGQVYYYFVRSDNGALSDYSNWIPAWRYEQNPGRAGDFNGDGTSDLLWWDPDTGQLKVWFMNSGAVQSVSAPVQGLDLKERLLVNTGDFNADGICDILWWNPETGEALVWYMAATSTAANGYTPSSTTAGDITGNVTLSYQGDLNGDGRADLVWRDYSTGAVTVWLMGEDGTPSFNGPPTLAEGMTDGGKPGVVDSLEWTLHGLYDMNADSKADVIWQHASNGRVVVWLMDGSQATGFSEFQRCKPDNWSVAGLGDLNGDRLGDIVWRNDASGQVQAWLLTGTEPAYEQRDIAIGDEAVLWQVKAVGEFCSPGCDDVYCKHSETGAVRMVKLDGQAFTPSVE